MTQTKAKMSMNSCCKVGANTVHPLSNIEGGNSDDDEEEDNLPELYTHKKLQSEYDRVALNEEDWQGMINRARLRGLREAQASEEDDGDDDGDQAALRPGEKLWEIGCQVIVPAILLGDVPNYHTGRKGGSDGIPLNAEGRLA